MISKLSAAKQISCLSRPLLIAIAVLSLSYSLPFVSSNELHRLDENGQSLSVNQLLAANQQQQHHHHNIPGHYEFEVAPKMEPPSVRKPPYQQSVSACPGSDPFAGFSPRDTLCGDLNQGRVPLNPLGQNVADQAYPFELIKNKTLQFLARALPVLKLEYETIPKVARYLPTNQLLNPTHLASPLSQEHMHKINQRFSSAAAVAADDELFAGSPYLRRRRRRSTQEGGGAGITAAELSPNASLVVSSAHSAGRILVQRNANETGAVITKDGYRSIQGGSASFSAATTSGSAGQKQQATQRAHNSASYYSWAPSIVQQTSSFNVLPSQPSSPSSLLSDSANAPNKSQKLPQPASGAKGGESSAGIGNNGDRQQNSNGQLQRLAAPASHPMNSTVYSTTISSHHNHAIGAKESRPEPSTGDSIGQARSSGGASTDVTPASSSSAINGEGVGGRGGGGSGNSSGGGAGGGNGNAGHLAAKEPSKRRLSCADSTNGFTSTICQVASALIEGDRPPAWLQVVKHLSNAYSGTPDSVTSANSPIWSVLSGLAQDSTPKSNSNSNSLTSAKQNLMSVILPLASLLSGSSAKDSSSPDYTLSQNKEHQAQTFGSSFGSTTLSRLALAGWASNAIASLVEYFVPSVFQTASRTFAKRKKPFDPQETFVDTPASVAAALSATNMNRQQQPGLGLVGKQPPTPCPSVEEYISPTFARNYQGAWKYVVQIPHEGYFTQTIQRTSCVRQKCEFTEGVCHESPRWVSLLVAEIYYPNTVFGQQAEAPVGSQSQMATAASNNHIQQVALQQFQQQLQQPTPPLQAQKSIQDPLQMTDSLNNYNHNLNNAFINAANELGWDPNNVANMQHLANAYNYQLLSRNGLMPSQLQAAESRSSPASYPAGGPMQPVNPSNNQASNQYSSQSQSHQQLNAQTAYSNEYITALMAAALQQNPNMNINDLLNSLQLQQKRKKRDLSNQVKRPLPSQFVANQNSQSRPHQLESVASINDITNHLQSQQLMPTNSLNPNQMQAFKQPQAESSTPVVEHQPSVNAQQVNGETGNQAQATSEGVNQVECDGHDKLGCYVVRVYYDWFLVNGSCKCWKTGPTSQAGSQTSNGNSFLRRIFTG